MAPSIHPPCTPSASCQAPRCHPTGPPCEHPEECLANTIRKNVPPCKSAVSIMRTRSKSTCYGCGKFNLRDKDKDVDPRKVQYIEQYLQRKSYERQLQRHDRLTGSTMYLDYKRSQGLPRRERDCCAGHGHRGRLARPRKRKPQEQDMFNEGKAKKKGCTIL